MKPANGIPYPCWRILACLLAFALGPPALVARPKADVLIMKNGDHITCEIKKLDRGQLLIKTSYTVGTIPVDWSKVERIESNQYFKVETGHGRILSGAIRREPPTEKSKKDFTVAGVAGETVVAKQDVVVLDQLEKSFLGNLDGSIDAGYSFTKGNDQTQFSLNGSLKYKTSRRLFQTSLSSLFSGQRDGSNTERHNLTASYSAVWKKNWYVKGLTGFLRSNQQQLNLRATFGGGVGRYLIHTNRTALTLEGGTVYTHENYSPDSGIDPKQSNLEGLTAVRFDVFWFDSTDISFSLNTLPSFTSPGRVRLDGNLDVKLDLIGDLYWKLSLWDNFDSQPPVIVQRNDFGISTTVGWSF